jgi:hypothetical protein
LARQRLGGGDADADAVRMLAIAFRRARRLIAGDELASWLTERGLSRGDWTGYLRRQVLREREPNELAEIVARHPVPLEEVTMILLSEAVCDGILLRCANTAVAWAAAAHDSGIDSTAATADGVVAGVAAEVAASAASRVFDLYGPEVGVRLARLLALRASHERFVTRVAGDRALRECFDGHRLGWLRLRGIELRFDDEGSAQEGAMCLREDRLVPADVARLAGAGLVEQVSLLEDAPPHLAPLLAGAQVGDIVGPYTDPAGRKCILSVAAREPPSPDDPELRERARRELVGAALEPLMVGTVRWHGSL